MALSTQNANLVRQKAYNAVYGQGTTTLPVSPFHFYALKALFLHLAANKGNPDLQYVPFSAAQITTNGGYNPDVDASKIYAFYIKGARTSGTTSSFVSVDDSADQSGETLFSVRLKATGQSANLVFPDGLAVATDINITAATTLNGATESSAADAGSGFLIVSAA